MNREEKFKHLNEIDALVCRMRSSLVDELSEDDLMVMMEVAVGALRTPAQRKAYNETMKFRDAMIKIEADTVQAQAAIQQIKEDILAMATPCEDNVEQIDRMLQEMYANARAEPDVAYMTYEAAKFWMEKYYPGEKRMSDSAEHEE